MKSRRSITESNRRHTDTEIAEKNVGLSSIHRTVIARRSRFVIAVGICFSQSNVVDRLKRCGIGHIGATVPRLFARMTHGATGTISNSIKIQSDVSTTRVEPQADCRCIINYYGSHVQIDWMETTMPGERKITPTLLMLKGDAPGRIFELRGESTVIGRHPDCDVQLNVEAVSRRHARIRKSERSLLIEDLDSRNGTHVNGMPITAPVPLEDGSYVQLCDYVFLFQGGVVKIEDDGDKSSTILGMLDLAESSSTSRWTDVRPEEKLRAVLEISGRIFGSTLQLRELLERTLESLFTIFRQADRGFALLRDERDGELRPMAIKYREGAPDSMAISRTILNHVLNERRAILSVDAGTDRRFSQSDSVASSKLRTVLCVPLLDQNRDPIGVIELDAQSPKGTFTEEDLDLIVAVAGQISIAIENARLHESLLHRRELEQGFRNAREVQKALLPRSRPKILGYQFWDYYEPAMLVGGDYFDYGPFGPADEASLQNPKRWAIAVGDVAGKGMPAALLMAKLSAEARMFIRSEVDPSRVVERLNQEIADDDIQDRFITFLLVIIDCETHVLRVVSAGHMAPIVRRARGVFELVGEDETGPPLAVVSGQKYRAIETKLEPGDVVVLYTDGVTEAVDSKNRQFGHERLRKTIEAAQQGPQAVGEAVLRAARMHVAGHAQSDDITLLCFGRQMS